MAEQKSRGYEWDKHNIKPDSYVFGSKPQNIAFNGVSKSIADVLTTTEEDRGPVVTLRAVSFSSPCSIECVQFCPALRVWYTFFYIKSSNHDFIVMLHID